MEEGRLAGAAQISQPDLTCRIQSSPPSSSLPLLQSVTVHHLLRQLAVQSRTAQKELTHSVIVAGTEQLRSALEYQEGLQEG